MFFNISTELMSILIIYLLFKDDINKMIIDFKKNNLIYFKKYFKSWFLVLILMVIFNGLILILDPNITANNQESINEMFINYPIYTFLLSVILAPIIEELIFRFSFRYMFESKWLFVLLSGTVFGLFHVIGSFESAKDFLYVIPYSIPGIVFAIVYLKSKNIFVPMWLHFVHNGSIMALQFFLLFYGI